MSNTADTRQLVEELNELLEQKQFAKLHAIIAETNEMDVALFMEQLTPVQQITCFRTLPKDQASDVFAELEPDTQQTIIDAITDQEIGHIIEDLFVDDAVDMLEEMPASVVKRVLKNAKPETRYLINQFLKYPEDSAGSIMTAEFMDLKKHMTVAQAIERIRRRGEDSESIYTCFVTNSKRVLEGVVSLKSLLLSPDDTTVEEIMDTDVIRATTLEDQESVAKTMMKYDFMAMAVVDQENRLVGIVTADDVMDVIQDEATEDIQKMAAIAPSDHPYLKTSVFVLAKNRIVWLLFLMLSAMVTGTILENYEAAFVAFPLLVTCMPMLTGTAGNAGSQASTLIIRGMSIGDIQLADWWKVTLKELRVAALCGAALCIVNTIRLMISFPGQTTITIVVSLSLFLIVIIAKFVGSLLPMLAKLIRVDPAIMASPLISTIMDSVSMLIYFNIARVFLKV
ncbi:MAG: magnesium transporter [Oscillospiraceae bacterium]|nr:magnesium transporter [Oscillospiraceae bacterium]